MVFFLIWVAVMLVFCLVLGIFCKIANIEEPASSVANSPIRSAVRRTFFRYRDMTPEQREAAYVTALHKQRIRQMESLESAIMIASVTSSHIKH